MSISSISGSSFYSKFMQLLSQEKQENKSSESIQAVSDSKTSNSTQTTPEKITLISRTDTVEISAAGRTYMQVRLAIATTAAPEDTPSDADASPDHDSPDSSV